jgi:hypothetical protein
MASKLCIGLFGTCGGSKWREPFKEEYQKRGIEYFDPHKDDWQEEDAVIEAEHLAEDKIILFPITSETYATGSLSEVGFSILNAISLDDRRDFVVLIDRMVDESLKVANPLAAKESIRARAIVWQHLKKLRLSNLYVVYNMQDMLKVSLLLYEAAQKKEMLTEFIIKQ